VDNILEVRDLVVRFYTYEGIVKAIEGVNLQLREGEVLGIIGETGSGKSVTALSILALVPPPGRVEKGSVLFRSRDGKFIPILKLGRKELQKIRGREISIIFQEPRAALNPLYTIGDQVGEVFLVHRLKELCKDVLDEINTELEKAQGFKAKVLSFERSLYERMLRNPESKVIKLASKVPIVRRFRNRLKKTVRRHVIELLRLMEMPDPERIVDMYPHELSGGMQQRVVIAMALACNPKILIADEPTTSLDVTVQAQILDLIRRLKRKLRSSILYITHDMGVIAELCDRVAVMYAGYICEVAPVREVFREPLHPYTRGLLDSIPMPGKELKPIRGTVPNLVNPPSGCRFHPRCPYAMDICSKSVPKLREVKKDHLVACHLYDKDGERS